MNNFPLCCRLLLRKELRWSNNRGRSASSFTRFGDYLQKRREQAERSVLIQLANGEVATEVKNYLQSTFGPLDSIYQYTIPRKSGQRHAQSSSAFQGGGGGSGASRGTYHWLLAEFSSFESVHKCLENCEPSEGSMPFHSSMCWYQSESRNGKGKGNNGALEGETIPVENLDGHSVPVPNFKKGATLSDQLLILEDSTKLTELGIRVRFLLASQLEKAFGNMFPRGCVLPFGSTVSGIGRQSGDLDLVLVPDRKEIFPENSKDSSSKNKGRLFAQTKLFTAVNTANARFQTQRVMETLADVIQLFVPGCSHVQRILQARVPILRFSSDFTDLQCDVSMTNSSGVHMSELIYIMTQIEPRFPTLLFAVRSWAAARKITNPFPGRQPTNFMFVMLLIYFLQQRQLLPTLDVLFNNAGPEDHRVTSDGIDCSFLRDTNQILKYFTPNSKDDSLAELLFHFFEFYAEFNFATKAVSLLTGSSWGKPDAGPLYIQNPLERHLNVARNVSKEEVTRLKNECCSALWKLETSWDSLHQSRKSGKAPPTDVTIKDLLFLPTLDSNHNHHNHGAPNEPRLQIKELFTK